ncbi:40951_t:CDS:1, partial [Gigaspora margarita]
ALEAKKNTPIFTQDHMNAYAEPLPHRNVNFINPVRFIEVKTYRIEKA